MQNNGRTDTANKGILTLLGESTLTDAMTEAGKTYEEIAQLVAEQVGSAAVAEQNLISLSQFSPFEHFMHAVSVYILLVAF